MRLVVLCLLAACETVFPLEETSSCWDQAATGDHDEDGLIDGCDPCPAIVDADPVSDADLDIVGDACDPEPALLGERIIAFDGFSDVASWEAGDGTWSQGDGSYEQTDPAVLVAESTLAVPPSRRPTVDVQYRLGTNDIRSYSEVFVDTATNLRVECKKRFGNGDDFLELVIAGTVTSSVAIGNTDQPVRLTLWQTADGALHCRVRQGTTDMTVDGMVGEVVTFNRIGLGLEKTSASFDAITVLRSE